MSLASVEPMLEMAYYNSFNNVVMVGLMMMMMMIVVLTAVSVSCVRDDSHYGALHIKQ